jgi:hypothetical protein
MPQLEKLEEIREKNKKKWQPQIRSKLSSVRGNQAYQTIGDYSV